MNVILAIAEDRAICESLRAALPEEDLVLLEPSLEGAIRRLITVRPDVILLDDSLSLSRKAIAHLKEAAPDTPLVVLSSRGDAETLAGYTLAGARACVVKPFSCDALTRAVESLVNLSTPAADGRPAPRTPSAPDPVVGQYQMALRWLTRTSSQLADVGRLSEQILDAMTDIFDCVRSAVLLENGEGVRVIASRGIPATVSESLRLNYATGLMRWLEAHACLIDRRAVLDAPDAVKELQVIGARLGAPLFKNGQVCGAVIVGDKASGLDYSREEREMLSALTRAASNTFENAARYRKTSKQQNWLDGILNNVTAGVVTVLPNRRVASLNVSAERILQTRAADVIGQSVQKLGSSFADVVLRCLGDGKPRLRQEIRDSAIDATLGLSVTPLGEGQGVVVMFSQLPEERASAEEIAYSPFWEYLSSRVAQEIKNPMVAINTFAQLLPRKYDAPDFREAFADVVQKEVARINNVVETLFGFARHPRLVIQQCKVNDTVRNVLGSFEKALGEKAIELETHLDPKEPNAEIDPSHFSQALQNVVQNSIDAMPAGGRLKVRTEMSDSGCEIVISDTGPGVPEQDAALIFMPFFSTKEQGMGLGLTIANRIMKQHEGDLTLVNDPEGGSAFALHLPSKEASNADDSGH